MKNIQDIITQLSQKIRHTGDSAGSKTSAYVMAINKKNNIMFLSNIRIILHNEIRFNLERNETYFL